VFMIRSRQGDGRYLYHSFWIPKAVSIACYIIVPF
jgi:hypothetical protein